MQGQIALECLDAAATAIDRALCTASAEGVEPVVSLLSRMSQELRAHRGAWWDLVAADPNEPDLDPEEITDLQVDQPLMDAGVVAHRTAQAGEANIGEVPNRTRWAFEGAGIRFRVCGFHVISDGGRDHVPVTLLWDEDGGANGRLHCADLRDAFGRAAQMIASASLWAKIER